MIFNTKHDVGETIGIKQQHNVLMEHKDQDTFQKGLMTLVYIKTRSSKGCWGKVPLIHFSLEKWKAT